MSGTLLGPLRERAYDDPPGGVRHDGWRHFFTLRNRIRPHVVGELLVLAFLLNIYNQIRAHTKIRGDQAVDNAQSLLRLEHHLGIAWEKPLNQWVSHHHTISNLFSFYYQYSHIPVTLGVLIFCYWKAPGLYRPVRTALVFTNVVGLFVYVFYPLAPPRLIPNGGFYDSVAKAGFGPTHGGVVVADQFGAMPSLHLAWATWVALTVCCLTHRWWVRGLAFFYTTLMAVTVIVTANHYVLDVIAGVADASLGIVLVRDYVRRRDRSLLEEQDLVPVRTAPAQT